jgi:hypothetical protein
MCCRQVGEGGEMVCGVGGEMVWSVLDERIDIGEKRRGEEMNQRV